MNFRIIKRAALLIKFYEQQGIAMRSSAERVGFYRCVVGFTSGNVTVS
jgi:hypothetical protein